MTELDENSGRLTYDYLESYFWWKGYVRAEPGLFGGLSFPINSMMWSKLMRDKHYGACPICHQIGSYSFVVKDGREHEVKCLCNVARWTYQQEQMTIQWRDAFESTPWSAIKASKTFGSIGTKTPEDASTATLNTMNKLFNFTQGNFRWHLLRGTFGCGKSTMAKIIATELYPIATFVTAGNLKNRFREESMDGNLSEMIRAFSKVRVLIIDDLGMEYDGSGFTSKSLRNIIDNRMAFPFKFPTIATTNLSLDEGDLRGGKNPDDTRAIVSRFLDPAYSDVHLLFQGDARRVGFQNVQKGG